MLRAVLCLCLCLCICCVAFTAEPPALPDPYGLGERLVLLEHLRDDYGKRPPPGATLDELRRLYAAAWQAKQAPAEDLEDHGRAERERRLRGRIADRHGVKADADLDETGLVALLHRLDAERAVRDQQAIADLLAADRDRQPAPASASEPAASPIPAAAPEATPAATAAAPVATKEFVRIAFKAAGVAECWLARKDGRSCLLVTFGIDHNGAFGTIREEAWVRLARAGAFNRSVLLLGHGGGTDVGGENIEAHLRTNKGFYETMGGTLPAEPVACLILASCSAGNPDQMRAMRDGLGYFPTWRVATGPRSFATQVSVIAAVTDIVQKPARPSWRGLYRMGMSGDSVSAFGEVGVDGDRAETTYWRLVQDETTQRWKTVEQR